MGRKRHLKGDRPPPDPFVERKAKALAALKAYQRDASFREDPSAVVDVLMDESDRGAIILVGTILEDVLGDKIIERLPDGKTRRDELFRQGGLLSSFQDKLTIGLALNLIDQPTYNSLDIIRTLRNRCAHAMRRVTVQTPQVRDVFSLLLEGDVADHVREGEVHPSYMRFLLSLVMIFHVERIRGHSQEVAQAAVDKVSDRLSAALDDLQQQREASAETPPEQAHPDGHQDQTGKKP